MDSKVINNSKKWNKRAMNSLGFHNCYWNSNTTLWTPEKVDHHSFSTLQKLLPPSLVYLMITLWRVRMSVTGWGALKTCRTWSRLWLTTLMISVPGLSLHIRSWMQLKGKLWNSFLTVNNSWTKVMLAEGLNIWANMTQYPCSCYLTTNHRE